MNNTQFPFSIVVADLRGLDLPVVTSADAHPITARGEVVPAGTVVEITEAVYNATVDREGNSFLDMSEAAQLARWGVARFLRTDEVPDDLAERVSAARRAQAIAERTAYLQANPRVLKSTGSTRVLEELDARIAG